MSTTPGDGADGRPRRAGEPEGSPVAGIHLVEVGVRWPPETFIAERLERLAARGMRVTVGTETSPSPDAPPMRGVDPLRLPRRGERGAMAAARALGALLALAVRRPGRVRPLVRALFDPPDPCVVAPHDRFSRITAWARLARLDPDVAHCEWNGALVKFLPVLELWGCPIVASSHGSDVALYPHTTRSAQARRGLQAAFSRVARYHFVCRSLRDEAVGLGMDPGRAVVIPNAVDPLSFAPPAARSEADTPAPGLPAVAGGAEPRELRVACVGWLRWMKGHEYAVRAIAELGRRGVPARLDIAGSDPDARVGEAGMSRRISYVARECGVSDRVKLLGRRSRSQVGALLRESDVLLQPSVSEGMPVSILEAMATGLPVVAADCGGVAEAVQDGVEGFVVPPRDPVALADALEAIAGLPDAGAEMGQAARRRVLQEFDISDQIARFEDLYAELSGGPG